MREVFRRARQASPCIIFFDEIDALAPIRGIGGDSQVSERVVSQLLTELDGIQSLSGVVILAATNRIDMVDPALLRAGRFDKLLYISQPDKLARKRIIEIHARNKPVSSGIDMDKIAEMTDGFSGADLTSVVNTAMSLVLQEYIAAFPRPEDARKNTATAVVTMKHFEDAIRKVKTSKDGKPPERVAVSYLQIGSEAGLRGLKPPYIAGL